MTIRIDELKCTGCGACIYACPVDVLEIEDMKCRIRKGCISCGACLDLCSFNAITMEEKTTGKKD
jgi:electron transfer flavoprotein alpha subunit